jgi:hypothetical protein
MKSRFIFAVPTVIAVVLAAPAFAATGSWSFENPKITKGEFPIRSACMMPAEGKLTKIGMKGGESMSKESEEWNTALQNLVEGHLKSASVDLVPALSTGASGASEDEVRQVVLQIEQKYDGISAKINRHPKDIAKSRYTLGDDVALLPCAAKADVIVFVRGEGQVVTNGKATMTLFVGGALPAAVLILTMADAKTGEILAFARLVNVERFGSKFMEDSEKVYGPGLNKQFKRLHIGEYVGKK